MCMHLIDWTKSENINYSGAFQPWVPYFEMRPCTSMSKQTITMWNGFSNPQKPFIDLSFWRVFFMQLANYENSSNPKISVPTNETLCQRHSLNQQKPSSLCQVSFVADKLWKFILRAHPCHKTTAYCHSHNTPNSVCLFTLSWII